MQCTSYLGVCAGSSGSSEGSSTAAERPQPGAQRHTAHCDTIPQQSSSPLVDLVHSVRDVGRNCGSHVLRKVAAGPQQASGQRTAEQAQQAPCQAEQAQQAPCVRAGQDQGSRPTARQGRQHSLRYEYGASISPVPCNFLSLLLG